MNLFCEQKASLNLKIKISIFWLSINSDKIQTFSLSPKTEILIFTPNWVNVFNNEIHINKEHLF